MPSARLTTDLIKEIAEKIMRGVFPHVAAASCGLPAGEFDDLISRGSRAESRGLPRALAQAVSKASAIARCAAEQALHGKNPQHWLMAGPGRDTPQTPGWAYARSAFLRAAADRSLSDLTQAILEALTPYPEARAAVAAALEQDE